MKSLWLMIPLGTGLLIPVLVQMNLRMARSIGDMEAAVLLHGVGVVAGVAWMGVGLRGAGFGGVGAVPWWAWLGGVIGLTGMAAMNRAIPEVGVASAVAVNVAAQLVAALLFEQWGLLGAELHVATPSRWLGAALLVLGAWLIHR